MTPDAGGAADGDSNAARGRDTPGDAIGFREGDPFAGAEGGAAGPRQEELLIEGEEQGAEAVAAVAAALKAAGATPVAAAPAPTGFATPSAVSRPMMAPFSVSDASDLEDAMSPSDAYLRQTGRGSAGTAASVAEGREEDEEEEEGGVEGVAEVGSAMDARAAVVAAAAAAAAVEGFSSPLSAEAGEDESFFDARESSVEKLKVGATGRTRGSGEGETPEENHGGGVGVGQGAAGDDERDSLSGDDGEWRKAVGIAASSENGRFGVRGTKGSNAEIKAGFDGRPTRGDGRLVSEADNGWSCSKVRERRGWRGKGWGQRLLSCASLACSREWSFVTSGCTSVLIRRQTERRVSSLRFGL